MPLQDGEMFAGYTIQRLLGSGGMGEVYLAAHPRLPRLDALKVLPAGLTGDDTYRERFLREADLAASLWNPHIVGVHDRGEHDGQLWISMDYVDGTDAAHLIAQYGPGGIPVPQVFDIVDAVAEALDVAHGRGLLHRDVKPANILLAAAGVGRQRILLTDFGIARHANDTRGLTETNMTIGTVNYAAPEQLLGQTLTGAADQYALAVTAYALLVGAPPFTDANPAVVIGKHLNAAAPPLSSRRPDLRALDPAFARALAKDPGARFPSCRAFAAALRAAAHLVPTEWAPIPQAYPHAPNPAGNQWTQSAPTSWPPGDPTMLAARDRSRRGVLPAALTSAGLVVLTAGACAVTFLAPHLAKHPGSPEPQGKPFVDFASKVATDLTSIDYRTIDSDEQKILDDSTGTFHDDFAKRSAPFTSTVRDVQSVSTGTVAGAAVESLDANSARVLVAMTVRTRTKDEPQQSEPRRWRMRVTVDRVGDGYKASNVEFVS